MRQTILLNEHGDTVIRWDESNDEKMREVIEKKLREGMTFFIIEPIFFDVFKRKKKTKDIDEIMERREIQLKDEDFNSLIFNNVVETVQRDSPREIVTKGIASTVDQVINNTTVAVTQRKGG